MTDKTFVKHERAIIEREHGKGGPFVAAVDHTRMPMILTDAQSDDRIIFANAAFVELLGYRAEEVLEKPWYDFTAEGPSSPRAQQYRREMEEGLHIDGQIELRKADGTVICAAFHGSPIQDNVGQRKHHFISVLDMTKQVQMEKELRSIQADLEKRVHERTQELEAALEQRDLLMKEVNHRVKNSLQLAASLLMLQAQLHEDEKVREGFREVQYRFDALARIHELLYRTPDPQHLDISEYLHTLLGTLAEAFPQTSGRVCMTVEAALLNVEIEQAIPLALIVNELVTNAFKHAFAQAQQGNLLVSLEPAGNGWGRLTVQDDGAGMNEGTARSNSLGLKLVRSLTGQIRGKLEITSKIGHGTRFQIDFPQKND
ncbi:sensor histidine kinase [Telmatospirillum sp. J64-1]|uniref:sensor histidine kinase n=1 Tax=Telmatospirillum sp. J64-1 TaxID=2502183 RepID=UPI00115F7104|nr:histidine kinase dimerization/phosphoacceptor domain -containing protein [Telmatospirillum sp. J64-1]